MAFSRAKNTLIIIGSSGYFNKYSKEHEMQKIGQYIKKNACNVEYSQFIKSEFKLQYNSSYLEKSTVMLKRERTEYDMNVFFNNICEEKAEVIVNTCEGCGQILKDGEEILCSKCLTGKETIKCVCCNNTIDVYLYDKYIRKIEISKLCNNCQKIACDECGKEIFIKKSRIIKLRTDNKKCLCPDCIKLYSSTIMVKCEECGKEIKYKYGYKKALEEEGLELPRICNSCKTVKVGICVACSRAITEKEWKVKKYGYTKPLIHRECQNHIWKKIVCRNCNEEFEVTYGQKIYFDSKNFDLPIICPKCREAKKEKVKVGTCCVCGGDIYQRGDLIRKYGMKSMNMHKECKNSVYITHMCKVCKNWFPITYGEKQFFESKGFNLPQKCKDCR